MKKMQYTVIFLIILAVLVFAGCKLFSGDNGTTDEPIESETPVSQDTTLEPGSDEPAGSDASEPQDTSESAAPTDPTEPSESVSDSTDGDSGETTTEVVSDPTVPPATDPSGSGEPTTAGNVPVVTSSTEYDIMRSGCFYMKGTMYDGKERNPISLGIDDDTVYMESSMDGVTLGFLLEEGSTYLLAPQQKVYCELGSFLSSILEDSGMLSQEEIQEMVNKMGFKNMKPLTEAKSVEDATVNGIPCKAYVYEKEDGSGTTRICLNGEKLVGVEKYNADGTFDSATYVDEISKDIPTLPPQDFKKQNIFSFMTSMQGLLD